MSVNELDAKKGGVDLNKEYHFGHTSGNSILGETDAYRQDPVRSTHGLPALDSTTIDLCLLVFPWAWFRATKAAAKMQMTGLACRCYRNLCIGLCTRRRPVRPRSGDLVVVCKSPVTIPCIFVH